MEEATFLKDAESMKLHKDAKELFAAGDHIKGLVIIEDMLSDHKEDVNVWFLHSEEGCMLMTLYVRTENPELKFTYLLGSLGCFMEHEKLASLSARAFYYLAEQIESVMYYKKCLKKAKQCLSVTRNEEKMSLQRKELSNKTRNELEEIIKKAEFKIGVSKTEKGLGEQEYESEDLESEKSPEPLKNENKELRLYWLGLDVKVKRDFMKVCTEKLLNFAEGHSLKGREALEEVLEFAKKDKKWTFWKCRATNCLKKFSSAEDCTKHFEQEHGADFRPCWEKDVVKRIGKEWAHKISVGGWEPVDTIAAVELIKNQLADVKAFAYKKGWSAKWPLADDKERSKLLKEIKLYLGMFSDLKILPCSIRDYVMRFPASHLEKLGVSIEILAVSHLKETPQSICFLECDELDQILDFLKRIKGEREDGADVVSIAVDSILESTRVIEKINFDNEFSVLLLDRRLLKSNSLPFNDERKIDNFDPSKYYGKAPAQGDGIISWLAEYKSVDKTFPRPIREHNLVTWVAVMRAVQYTCRTLGSKYEKKRQYLEYDAALTMAKDLCMSESERRKNLDGDQVKGFASLLCDRCEEDDTQVFVWAVRDVLKEMSAPILCFPGVEECMNSIREHNSLDDERVLNSIQCLKTVLFDKILLTDSKILLVDNSRTSLLNDLTKLSGFDNRTYILQVLKPFLLSEIMDMMDSKTKKEAYLLLEDEKKPSKKTKDQTKKKNPKSMSSDPSFVNHEPEKDSEQPDQDDTLSEEISSNSVNLEPESTSSSLKPVEEDCVENDPLEVSSNTVNQEKDITESEPLESTLGEAPNRYNSALDMTLKALLNIKILKEDLLKNREPFQPVPPALENFFTATVSEVIKTEEIYPCLLSDLLAALEEDISMSNDAAEVLVAILEFWQCWKNPERESLVTRLFTLEEYERMICRKCRKKPNYPEQSSYGIVIAANSIRNLKCVLGDIDFVDILKIIRMEYKMVCDIKTGGCGRTNIVHHVISKCPPIFTIVLEWGKCETEKQISETTNAVDWEIDISMLYEGLDTKTKYRLVSMVGCGEEEDDHICIAYENNRWINLRTGKVVGNWKSVVRFCEERKVRPEILFYEAARSKEEIVYDTKKLSIAV